MIELKPQMSLALRRRHANGIDCVAGVLWVTRTGDPRDHFLYPGDSLALGTGLTVVTALSAATVRLAAPPAGTALRALIGLACYLVRRVAHPLAPPMRDRSA